MREWIERGVSQGRFSLSSSGLAVRAGVGVTASPQSPASPETPSPVRPMAAGPSRPLARGDSATTRSLASAQGGEGAGSPGCVIHTGGGPPAEVVRAVGVWLMSACEEDAAESIESLATAVTRALKGHLSLEAGLREHVQEHLRTQADGLSAETVGALFAGLLRGLQDPGSRASIFRLVRLLANACEGGRLGAPHVGAAVSGLARVLSVRDATPKWSDLVDCLVHFRLPTPAWTAAVRALAEATGGVGMPASHRVHLHAVIERRAATHGDDWGRAGLLGLRLGTWEAKPPTPAAAQSPRPLG